MTRVDTETLWLEYLATRDDYFRDLLFEHYLPHAQRKAMRTRVFGRARTICDSDDIESISSRALLRAIETHNPRKKVPFLAYARTLIGYAITDEMRRVLAHPQPVRLTDLNDPGITEQPLARAENVELARKAIEFYCQSDREHEIFELRFLHGHTLREVGAHFGVSESRICNIIKRVLRGRPRRRSRGGRLKLPESRHDEIRERYSRGDIPQRELARLYGVSQPWISAIVADGPRDASQRRRL